MKDFWRGTLKLIAFVALALVSVGGILKLFFVDVVTVAHNGMAPTILIGDRVLVWRGATPERNDVMLCRHPREPGRWVISRVALEPGESLLASRGQLQINRHRLDRDVRGEVLFHDRETGRSVRMQWGIEEFVDRHDHLYFQPIEHAFTIRAQANVRGYYLLGDNRGHMGEDSRTFGIVEAQNCTGQVFMRLTAAEGAPDGIPHGIFDRL